MIHTLFSWSPARSLQLAFEALSEEKTILKQDLAHVQMSQKHQSFSRGKIPAETQHVCDLAVQKKGTTCQKALVAEGLGASCVIHSTFLDYCFVIFPAGHDQLGKTLSLPRMPVCYMLAGQCCSQREPTQPVGCVPHAGRVWVAAHSTCCPTASCPCCALVYVTAGRDAAKWRGASSFAVFLRGSVVWNCFQISSPDSFVWLGFFKYYSSGFRLQNN